MNELKKEFVGEQSDHEVIMPNQSTQYCFITSDEHEVMGMKFQRFCHRLSWILFFLYLPIAVSSISLVMIVVESLHGIIRLEGMHLQHFLGLVEIIILFGLASTGIQSIRKTRRPFTKTMSVCIFAVGIVAFVFSAALMPSLFPRLRTGYDILQIGNFCMDGFYGTIGILIILFSRIYHYGVELQKSEDLTI